MNFVLFCKNQRVKYLLQYWLKTIVKWYDNLYETVDFIAQSTKHNSKHKSTERVDDDWKYSPSYNKVSLTAFYHKHRALMWSRNWTSYDKWILSRNVYHIYSRLIFFCTILGTFFKFVLINKLCWCLLQIIFDIFQQHL